jgi:hypothetical protein
MTISGFTMVRNADKYYFPIKESIESILPIVDEFVVALGNCDAGDKTRELIESIGSSKIKIFERTWDEKAFVDGKIFADETTFALHQCKGDWCFYLQADEVVHEQDLPAIQQSCNEFIADKNVDGLLFKYYHFFADYDHYMPFHGWYKNEIRIVRNGANIFSYKDAQSFRKNDFEKLNVKAINAHIYHYGWVRPPHLMQAKKKEQDGLYHDKKLVEETYSTQANDFDFGALGLIPVFEGTHPKLMNTFIQKLDWKHKLNYSREVKSNRHKLKHERLKNRILSYIENKFLGGREMFGYSNWNEV